MISLIFHCDVDGCDAAHSKVVENLDFMESMRPDGWRVGTDDDSRPVVHCDAHAKRKAKR